MKMRGVGLVVALVGLLAGCGGRDELLPGERFDLRERADRSAGDVVAQQIAPLRLPQPVANADWTHRNGGPAHRIAHPALAATPALQWTATIGAGEDRRRRITADPVVAGGRVFTLDAGSRVMAISTSGETLWSQDLAALVGRRDNVSGGGLAFGEGRLFATSAVGTLTALDPATGNVHWIQRFDAPVTAAPTVSGGLVYVVAADSSAWALDFEDGRVRWQLPGTPSVSSMIGGAGPAVTDRLVIFPFASGEVTAALRRAGVRVWGTTIAGQRRGRAWASISDITGDPVVSGDVIYVGNQSGRVVALDRRNGERRWTATEAAYSPVWPEAGAVFLVSDEARLVRLDAATGATVWARSLPFFTTDRERRRREVHTHYGPVLAGGRLIVASNDGTVRAFSPDDGALLSQLPLPGGAAANPVVAGRTLYVVTTNGRLHAFR